MENQRWSRSFQANSAPKPKTKFQNFIHRQRCNWKHIFHTKHFPTLIPPKTNIRKDMTRHAYPVLIIAHWIYNLELSKKARKYAHARVSMMKHRNTQTIIRLVCRRSEFVIPTLRRGLPDAVVPSHWQPAPLAPTAPIDVSGFRNTDRIQIAATPLWPQGLHPRNQDRRESPG